MKHLPQHLPNGPNPVPVPPPGHAARLVAASQLPTEPVEDTPDPTDSRGPLRTGLLAALILVGGLGGWGSLASIDGAILAQGQVEVLRTRLVVQHPEGGRVAELHVADGDTVAAGELILRLDPGLLQAERDIVEGQYVEALARAARLTAERDDTPEMTIDPVLMATRSGPAADIAGRIEGQRRMLAARRETADRQVAQLHQRRAQAEAQQAGLSAQLGALEGERALIEQDLMQQTALLDRGLTASARVLALRREVARMTGTAAAARAEQAALAGRITEIDLQVLALRAGRREEAETALRDLDAAILELATRRRALDERLQRLEMRTPVAGRIHALAPGGPGAVLRAAEPAAEIVPVDIAPQVAVRIRPEDIDRIHPGQPVRVLLPASGGRERTEVEGRITLLSPDALEDPRTGQRHFRAEIGLDPDGVAALDDRTLPPGLPVEAQIRTGARSPLAWVLAPLTTAISRAMREG
jgi:HlyD family secretion protein